MITFYLHKLSPKFYRHWEFKYGVDICRTVVVIIIICRIQAASVSVKLKKMQMALMRMFVCLLLFAAREQLVV